LGIGRFTGDIFGVKKTLRIVCGISQSLSLTNTENPVFNQIIEKYRILDQSQNYIGPKTQRIQLFGPIHVYPYFAQNL